MEKFANTAKLLIILSASMIIVCCLTYNYNTSAVSHDDSTKIFKVEGNETFLTIADELKKENLKVEVVMQDERLSTKEAHFYMIKADMSRKKRKQKVDSVAATIILETFMERRKNNE